MIQCLTQHFIERRTEGRGWRKRRHKQLMHNLKDKGLFWKLKCESLWRTRFGRHYGTNCCNTDKQNECIFILYDTSKSTGAVEESSVTMRTVFLPLCYQAIIMIEAVEMKNIRTKTKKNFSTISSYLTQNSRVAVMRKTIIISCP